MIIDGVAVPAWSSDNAEDMKAGGATAINLICSIWEDFRTSMRRVAELKSFIVDNSPLLRQVYAVEDIDRAARASQVGLIMSFANSSAFDGHLPSVKVFHELGLRMVQITFNTANAAGSGCYDAHDGGLTEFGRELVFVLEQTGIAVNLTHLGDRTAREVVGASTKPVCYTHCCPRSLCDHFRNKSDKDIKNVADKGGVIGVAAMPHYLPSGLASTIDDYVVALLYVYRLAGEDHVAIGTNMTPGQPDDFYQYVSRDKGSGRQLVDYSVPPRLPGLGTFRDYGQIAEALSRTDVPQRVVDKIMGRNWYRFYSDVW